MTLLRVIDLLGVAMYAVAGALAAGRKQLDLMGVAVVAMASSIGGGTIRDLLMDRRPIFWIQDPTYLYVILAATGVMMVLVKRVTPPMRALLIADAMGLAFYGVLGAQIAEEAGLAPIVCVLMGTLTGAGGGVVRDVLVNEVPLVLRKSPLYATAAVAGIVVYLGAKGIGTPATAAALLGMATILGLRFGSILFGLSLPVFEVPDGGERAAGD